MFARRRFLAVCGALWAFPGIASSKASSDDPIACEMKGRTLDLKNDRLLVDLRGVVSQGANINGGSAIRVDTSIKLASQEASEGEPLLQLDVRFTGVGGRNFSFDSLSIDPTANFARAGLRFNGERLLFSDGTALPPRFPPEVPSEFDDRQWSRFLGGEPVSLDRVHVREGSGSDAGPIVVSNHIDISEMFKAAEPLAGVLQKRLIEVSRLSTIHKVGTTVAEGCTVEEGFPCFLTTAAVHTIGLSDDCFELSTLRNFRDTHLMNDEEGRGIVAEYNLNAPGIVAAVEKRPDSVEIWKSVYAWYILPCAIMVRLGFKKMALHHYHKLFNKLYVLAK